MLSEFLSKTLIVVGIFVFCYFVRKTARRLEQQAGEDLLQTNRSLRTTRQWCDASKAFLSWIEEHPWENLSHPEAQRLLRIETGAYMLWLDAHPYCPDDGHLAFLMELMEDWVV